LRCAGTLDLLTRLGFVRAEVQRYFDTTQLFLALGGSPLPDRE